MDYMYSIVLYMLLMQNTDPGDDTEALHKVKESQTPPRTPTLRTRMSVQGEINFVLIHQSPL